MVLRAYRIGASFYPRVLSKLVNLSCTTLGRQSFLQPKFIGVGEITAKVLLQIPLLLRLLLSAEFRPSLNSVFKG